MKKRILKIIKNPVFFLSIILIVGLILRALEINTTSFWYDEAFTGDILKLSWKEMFEVIAADKVHPPLFYILIRIWSIFFGVTQVSLRGFSIFFGLGTSVMAYVVGKNIFNKDKYPLTGLILAFVVSISPFFVTYSLEARAYSFLAFLALALAYFVLRYLKSKKKEEKRKNLWISISLALVMLLTHYLQIVFLIALVCAVLLYKYVFTEKGINKKLLIGFLSSVFLIVLSFTILPVADFMIEHGMVKMWWIPHVEIQEFLRIYYSYFLGVVRYISGVPPVRELSINIPYLLFGGIMLLIHVIGFVLIQINKKISIQEKSDVMFFFFLGLITFLGFHMLGLLSFDCFVERYTIAGGIILLVSFWMVLSRLIRNWLVLIPVGLYVGLTFLLVPMPTFLDYREISKDLDTLDVERYVFTSPADLINSQFYMNNTNVYYFFEYEDQYEAWALLSKDRGVYLEDITEMDILVVPVGDVSKWEDNGFTKIRDIDEYLVLMDFN